MGMNLDEVIAEFDARYTNHGQTKKDVKVQLFQPSETEKYFNQIPKKEDYHRKAYATMDRVLQAFTKEFVPNSSAQFRPWETKLGTFKIDDQVSPDDVRESWLGFWAKLEEKDRAKWPILLWYVNNLLIPQSHEDFETEVAYWGWQMTDRVAVPTVDGSTFVREISNVAGTVMPANASMDGIRTQMIKMNAIGRLQVINTGTPDADDELFCTQIEEWFAQIPRLVRRRLKNVFMSEDLTERYQEGRRLKYNLQYSQVTDMSKIKESSAKVVGLPSMEGSNKWWTTLEENRTRPTHTENKGVFDRQKVDRYVKLLTDFKKVICFDVPELVFTNDQENVITAGEITARYS